MIAFAGIHLQTTNGIEIVENAMLEIPKGKLVILTGESGVGKTTLGKALKGIVDQNHFTFELQDSNIRENEIGYLWQDPTAAISPGRNLLQLLKEVLYLNSENLSTSEIISHTEQLLIQVGLSKEGIEHKYINQISKGQAQRFYWALVLATKPRLIIADEPMSSLDNESQKIILNLIRKLMDSGHFMLVISHQPQLYQNFQPKQIQLKNGALIPIIDHQETNGFQNTSETFRYHLLLEISNLTFRYRSGPILFEEFNLKISLPHVTGIVGASGKGKSTLLKLLGKELTPDFGNIQWTRNAMQVPDDELVFEIIPQNVYNSFSPFRKLRSCFMDFNPIKKIGKAKWHELLDQLEISQSMLQTRTKNLSGGQIQRAAIVRALIHQPQVLAFDESFTGLDKASLLRLWPLILESCIKNQCRIMVVSHDRDFLTSVSEKIIEL